MAKTSPHSRNTEENYHFYLLPSSSFNLPPSLLLQSPSFLPPSISLLRSSFPPPSLLLPSFLLFPFFPLTPPITLLPHHPLPWCTFACMQSSSLFPFLQKYIYMQNRYVTCGLYVHMVSRYLTASWSSSYSPPFTLL